MARDAPTAPMVRYRRTAATSGAAVLAVALAALLLAVGAGSFRTLQGSAPSGVTRTYYIGADPVLWNYTPSGHDVITGTALGASNATVQYYTERNATYLGTSFEKCLYQQFVDASFTALEPRPAAEAYLGLLGPVIYAAVGDTVQVWFHNACPWAESIAPEGVEVAPSSDGTNFNGSVSYGGSVPTNGTVEYTWLVPPSAGPGSSGAPAALWLYQSGTQAANSTDLGLIGPILISAAGANNPDGTPAGPAENVILLASDLDENDSTFLRYNVEHFAEDPSAVDLSQPRWVGSLNKYSINGFLYGNLPPLTFPHGTEVVWWLLGAGRGYPTLTWTSGSVRLGGVTTDRVPLAPSVSERAVMWANTSGTWLVESSVPGQLAGGLEGQFVVSAATPAAARDLPWGPARSSAELPAPSALLGGAARWA